MKKLSKLKLNEISKRNLSQKEMRHVKGGYKYDDTFPHHSCGCGCYYADGGGSSTKDNYCANRANGLWSEYRGDYAQVSTITC